ncbi:aminotransferase class I/II-fold pyridoxal phosphate-dependent enzyme [Xinfangfangia sp. D13-10-4-6]|uniref:pyridoxal phosphate-dependent aminotransferase n=1 Tax=Pseudogemmobacter hezensis TaxID=2737662 RepID=UPI0015553E10|nr:aminotransferase class I/II-fold pyridoxal phosphate-dependent enzyme [Pseudogemmobacter hezensis]NPD16150.1 aminotransferase class I/II-fold pyridoxal phosphate-dependent enzyme [Pseudogemmobacter hezensis]
MDRSSQRARRGDVDPFIVMDVMEHARALEEAGRSIIHMEVGQPGTPAPKGARQALARALDQPLGYTVALGLPALRQGIADLYHRWYGITLDPARVVVTAGSSGAFLLAFTALFEAGQRVGLGEPGYPSYRQILRALSLVPVGIPAQPENRLQPVPADLAGHDIDGLIVASPGNPSGTMLDHAALSALISWAEAKGVPFISDEIYHGLHYGERAVSALEISQSPWVINSFSKYFSMTGWRIGWMVVPEDQVRRVERLAQNMFICPPHPAQLAALAALDCEAEMEENRAVYRENRRLMLEGLPEAGFTKIAPPDGAFYIYADVSDLTDDSLGLAREILEGAGVAVTPGLDFDPKRGHQTLRFSYARSTADIAEGLRRLKAFMAAR